MSDEIKTVQWLEKFTGLSVSDGTSKGGADPSSQIGVLLHCVSFYW